MVGDGGSEGVRERVRKGGREGWKVREGGRVRLGMEGEATRERRE